MNTLIVRQLGLCDYHPVVEAMQAFTDDRGPDTIDEVWLLQHRPVYTLGRAARDEHVLAPGDIPVVRTDRGGQVTYHGPGQLVAYLLIDLQRRGLGIRQLVRMLEETVIQLLSGHSLEAAARPGAPGVYVEGRKIASLGLRVRRGCSYHGLSLNIGMDLEPFRRINPCGYPGLEVTDMHTLLGADASDAGAVTEGLLRLLTERLGYDTITPAEDNSPGAVPAGHGARPVRATTS